MRYSITAAALAMASTVSAHSLMYGVWVNGKDQGDGRGKYIRTPPNNNPVKDLASPNIVCNVNGGKAVSGFVSAAAGDKLSFEWQHDNRGDDIIAASHVGPIITYIAKFTEGDGTGPIWSKIAEEGFEGGKWAVDKLIANKGKATEFAIPADLAAGKYLIRQEIIAHHESESTFNVNPARGAQFYPSCVQFDITGSGSTVPDQAFDFNKGYTYSDPGIKFDVYNKFTSYPIPGPEVFSGSSASPPPSSPPPAAPPSTPPPATTPPATPGNGDDDYPAPPASPTDSGSAPSPIITTIGSGATAPPSAPPTVSEPPTAGNGTSPAPGRPSGRPGRGKRPGKGKKGTGPKPGNGANNGSQSPDTKCNERRLLRRARRAAARRARRAAAEQA